MKKNPLELASQSNQSWREVYVQIQRRADKLRGRNGSLAIAFRRIFTDLERSLDEIKQWRSDDATIRAAGASASCKQLFSEIDSLLNDLKNSNIGLFTVASNGLARKRSRKGLR